MTYKELVDSIKSTVDRHLILQDFGYGALTDIKTVDEGTRVNYPYAFLNPTQSTRTGQTVTYRFNLIVMDVAQEDPTTGFADYLEVQSNCQQYIDDILANLRFAKPYEQFDLTLNVNLTPFKERFQDTVAGMTATLEMELPLALNDCITPIRSNVLVEYGFNDNAIAEPDPTGQSISTKTPTYDTESLYGTCNYTGVFVPELKQYEIEVTGTAQALEAKPITQAPNINPNRVDMTTCTSTGSLGNVFATKVTGWPQGQTTTTAFEWSATYIVTIPALAADEEVALLWALRGADPADESQMEFINTDINIYEL